MNEQQRKPQSCTCEDNEQLRRLHGNVTRKKISKTIDNRMTAIHKQAVKPGLRISLPRKRETKETIAYAKYIRGNSNAEIAEEISMTKKTISTITSVQNRRMSTFTKMPSN